MNPWGAALRLVAAVLEELRGQGEVTGRRWRRGAEQHPAWCALDHTCSAHRLPGGAHRSAPMMWRTSFGSLVATRTGSRDGSRSRVEIRLDVTLSAVDDLAGRQVQALVPTLDLATRAALAHTRESAVSRQDVRSLPAAM